MTEQAPNPVVVAVGYEPCDAALAYAATEAGRAGCALHVVHVVHQVTTGPEIPLLEATDLERIGRQTLGLALEHVRSLVPEDTAVTGEVVHGSPVPAIVSAARDARVVVLQRRMLSRIMRVVTRSVSSGVAARAKVPVVSVPSSWGEDPERERLVTVGVEDPDRARPVLAAALEAARARGLGLRVLHTWWYPGVYDDIVTRRTEDDEWAERARSEIRAVLDTLDTTGVEVRIDARHAWPADALVAASHDSALLVVGRHDPRVPFGSHLGPVARAVLHEAACPVELVDPARSVKVSA